MNAPDLQRHLLMRSKHWWTQVGRSRCPLIGDFGSWQVLTVILGQVRSTILGAGNGKNKLVFGVMHCPRWIILAVSTCECAFVVETWEQLRFFCLCLCGGCTTRGVPERLVQFGVVHLKLRLLQEAAKLASLCVFFMDQLVSMQVFK